MQARQADALVTHGTDCEESEVAGRAMAERDPALEYVSPYNGSIIYSVPRIHL